MEAGRGVKQQQQGSMSIVMHRMVIAINAPVSVVVKSNEYTEICHLHDFECNLLYIENFGYFTVHEIDEDMGLRNLRNQGKRNKFHA